MSKNIPYNTYVSEVIVDGMMGITLGILVNTMTNFINTIIGGSYYSAVILQILLIALVLYALHNYGGYFRPLNKDLDDVTAGYGPVFMSLFLASQINIIHLIYIIDRRFESSGLGSLASTNN